MAPHLLYMNYRLIRILGIIGIIGAPWVLIDFINNGLYERFKMSSWSGVRGLLFITGWTCSIIGLYLMGAMGTKRWQKWVMCVQLFFLLLANCWNVVEIFNPNAPVLRGILNASWPLAGLFMLVTGMVLLRAHQLTGWKRYMPLLAGLWFPQTIVLAQTNTLSVTALVLSGMYATIVFILLALCLVINTSPQIPKRRVKVGAT